MGVYSWNGGNGDWGTKADWNGGVPNTITADATIAAGGTYTVTIAARESFTVDSLLLANNNATLDLAGTLAAGTITIASGTLLDDGGALSGATAFYLENGVIALNGHGFTLAGPSELQGAMTGPGNLAITGDALLYGNFNIAGGATLTDSGIVTQATGIGFGNGGGDTTMLAITSGGVYEIVNDTNIGTAGTVTLRDAGLFEKTAGRGISYIGADLSLTSNGTVAAALGGLALDGGGSIQGTLAGGGEIYLNGGTFAIGKSAVFDVATLAITGNTNLLLNGGTIALADQVALNNAGITGPGTLDITGTADVFQFDLTGGAMLVDAGTVTEDGYLQLGENGTDSASLKITGAGKYEILNDSGIGAQGTTAIINNGLFEKLADNGNSYIDAAFTNNSSGTIEAAAGAIVLQGGGTLAGALTGAGLIDLDGGVFTLATTTQITVATFQLNGNAQLQLAGTTTLSNKADLDTGILAGPGTLDVTGGGDVYNLGLTGGAVLQDAGTLTQDGNFGLGQNGTDSAALKITSHGVYDLMTENGIYAQGAATINNAGLFEKTGTDGQSNVAATFINGKTGTIDVVSGVIDLAGGGSLAGTLAGAGEIALTGGTFTLAGAVLDVATFAIAGAALALGGQTITLFGNDDFAGGNATGPGTLVLAGQADIDYFVLTGGAELLVTGTVTEDNSLVIGANGTDSASLSIASGGVYDMIDDSGEFSGSNELQANGTGTATDSGLFEKTGGIGGTDVTVSFTETSKGVIDAVTGTLVFLGGGKLAGTLAGNAIQINNGFSTMTIAAGAVLTAQNFGLASGNLSFNGNENFAHDFYIYGGALDLNGHTLKLAGSVDIGNGLLTGAGTLEITGTGDVNSFTMNDGATLLDAGTIIQNAQFVIGNTPTDTPSITIAANAVYDFTNDTAIYSGFIGLDAAAAVVNAGLLEKTAGLGDSAINIAVVNQAAGTIGAFQGEVSLGDGLVNNGLVTIANGSFALNGGMTGNGTIILGASAQASIIGYVGAGETIAFAGAGDELSLNNQNNGVLGFGGTIAGFAAGDTIDLNGVIATNEIDNDGLITLSQAIFVNGNFKSYNTVGEIDVTGTAATNIALATDGNGGTLLELGAGNIGNQPQINTTTWAAATGNWNVGVNWAGTIGAPNSALVAYFNPGLAGDTVKVTGTANTAYQLLSDSNSLITLNIASLSSLVLIDGGVFYGAVDLAQTGVLDDLGGNIVFQEGGLIAGTLAGAGSVDLNQGIFTLAASAVLGGAQFLAGYANAQLLLESNRTITTEFGMGAGTVSLGGHTLSLAGPSSVTPNGNAIFTGPGTLNITGTALFSGGTEQIESGALLLDSGGIIQNDQLYLGGTGTDTSAFTIASHALYEMNDGAFVAGEGAASVVNKGLIETVEAGQPSFQVALTNASSGTIDIGGTLGDLSDSYLYLSAGGSLNGTITGAGELYLSAGATTLANAAVFNVANLAIATNADLVLGGNRTYAGNIQDVRYPGGTINLNGHSLALTGDIYGAGFNVVGAGTINIAGYALEDDYSNLNITNALLLDSGTIQMANPIILISSTLSIANEAVFDITADNQIFTNGTAAIVNAGLFEMTSDNGYAVINPTIVNTAKGTIAVARGQLFLTAGTLGGTLAGAGQLELHEGTTTLLSTAVLNVATFGIDSGENLILQGSRSYAGIADLGATITGGTLDLTGSGIVNGLVLSGGALLEDTGLITETNNWSIGNSGTDRASLSIASIGIFDIVRDGNVSAYGTAAIINAGLFEKTASGGGNGIYAAFTNTGTGIIDAVTGNIALYGGGHIAGTLTGAGEIDLAGGVFTLTPSAVVNVASFTVTDGSALNLNGNTDTISAATGLYGNAQLNGPGTLDITGTADINGFNLAGGAVLEDSGFITQDAVLNIGLNGTSNAALSITGAGTFDILTNTYIGGNGNNTITNAGLFERTGDFGGDQIYDSFVNTGTIDAVHGLLNFYGGTFGGTLTGGGDIDLGDSNFFTLAAGAVINVATFGLGFTNYATIALAPGAITVSGALLTDGAELDGPGTLTAAGTGDIYNVNLEAGAVLNVTGSITQDGYFNIGAGTLQIAAGGAYELLSDFDNLNINGGGAIANAGLFIKAGDNDPSAIDPSFTNTGTIEAELGNLTFETLMNDAGGTLTGGTYLATALESAGGDISIIDTAGITTDAATVILSGAGADIFSGPQGTLSLESSLTSIAAGGTLDLNGHNYTTTNTIKDAGDIIIGADAIFAPGKIIIANGGTLDIATTGTVAGNISFSGTGGALIIESKTMPANKIYGFAAGDTIALTGITYAAGASVTVGQTNIVTITDDGSTYKLNIQGATKGETDFTFGSGSLLTKSATPKMAFLKPHATTETTSSLFAPVAASRVATVAMAVPAVTRASCAPWMDLLTAHGAPLLAQLQHTHIGF